MPPSGGAGGNEPPPGSDARMSPTYQQLLQLLRGYLSATNAEGLLQRTIREMDVHPQELSAFMRKETVKWREVIQRAGIEPE